MDNPTHQRPSGEFWFPFLTVLSDALAIEGAFLFSYYLRFETSLFDWLGFLQEGKPPIAGYLLGSLFIILIWLLLFNGRKLYSLRRDVTLTDELFNVVRVASLGMLIVMSVAFFYRDFSYSRLVFILLWAFSIALLLTGRGILLFLERRSYRKGHNLQRGVVVGGDSLANEVFSKLHLHPVFGCRILGYFADRPAHEELQLRQAPHLGPLSSVSSFLERERVDRVFVALRSQDHAALFDIITDCEGLNVEFMMVPDVLELLTSNVRVMELEGIPFLRIKGIPFTPWGRITKRGFDIVVTVVLLSALSPLMLLIAAAIRLDSRGPVLFRQKRVGLDGKEFTMLKFRSMVMGADQYDREAGLGIRDDPRRTRLGKFLRTTSLDELPQLLNVLAGDMSLVGPRPERTHFVSELKQLVPKYLDRHRVKTGVTGWAQVNGLRGDTSIAERIRFDLFYIENWSLSFDVKILLRTFRAVVTPTEKRR